MFKLIRSSMVLLICLTTSQFVLAEKNVILDDPTVIQALKDIDPQFGDLAVRMAGEVWGRPGLTQKERALISIAGDVCNQTLNGPFQFHVNMALQNGATRRDVTEALMHMTIYGAFPKVLQATDTLNQMYAELDAQKLYLTGDRVSHPGLGDKNYVAAPEVAEALLALDAQFGDLAVRMAGEVWGRPGLSQKERAFMSLGADVCNQTLNGPLQFHINMALKAGASRAEVKEAVLHMTIYGAFPKVLQAITAVNQHFDTLNESVTQGE